MGLSCIEFKLLICVWL